MDINKMYEACIALFKKGKPSRVGEEFLTYRYYNEKKQRMAIRGVIIVPHQMKITMVACSKKDDFDKRKIRTALREIQAGGIGKINNEVLHETSVTILFEESPKYAFIKFCNDHFLKAVTVYEPVVKLVKIN